MIILWFISLDFVEMAEANHDVNDDHESSTKVNVEVSHNFHPFPTNKFAQTG